MMYKFVPVVLLAGVLAWAPASPESRGETWAGRWAMELRLASVANIPLFGDQRSVMTSRVLVDLWQNGNGWIQRHHVCEVRVEGDAAGARIIIPPAFVRSIPTRQYPIALLERQQAWSYTADMGIELIGLDPGFAESALPRTAKHPSVRDTDGDGAPGATIQMQIPALGRVKLYVVQRSHLVLNGYRAPDGSIRGTVDILVQEQRTIGAKPGFLRRSPSIRPDPANSQFTLLRVERSTTCPDLSTSKSDVQKEHSSLGIERLSDER